MRKFFYLLTILSFQQILCYGQIDGTTEPNTDQISIGVRDQFYSETLGEERALQVHIPASSIYGYNYPVLYLLDGEFHFESVVGILKAGIMSRKIPEMIIVGISNTNRYRDLSTVHVGDANDPSGGAEKFTDFIEHELIPYIDSKYPTIDHRTFVGHSLGGLVVVNTLMQRPHLFTNYLAIDPSLSWGNDQLLKEARSTVQEAAYENKSLFIAVANTIGNEAMSFEEALADNTTATLHLRSIVEFSELAASNDQLVSKWKYYPEESHGSLPIIAEHQAFPFLFSWFEFKYWNEFYMPEPTKTGDELVDLLVTHHNTITSQLGYPYPPNEYEINMLGYMYLDRNDPERAYPFFELNIQNYPESANTYDSMGDYYNRIADTPNAIKYFTKALELGGVEGTKEKLEELKAKK